MVGFRPSLDPEAARRHLELLLVAPPWPASFQRAVKRLNDRFLVYAATSPAPLPAPGLAITPEIRCQSEIYLPIKEVAGCFNRLYRSALAYPPIFSSTPFHDALSWADAFSALPPKFQFSANPARLLEALFGNRNLLQEFIFACFLPRRFYGGFVRYPKQEAFIREELTKKQDKPLRCLDAACGDGAGCYGLARLLLDGGWQPDQFAIEGWTLEPLEIWAAAHVSFPHDPHREWLFRSWTGPVFELRADSALLFRQADLLQRPPASERFDLILCNGLLGGPIINRRNGLSQAVSNLAALLRPGGVLLAADHFHGGWKKQNPGEFLGALCKECGLKVMEAGEGIAALKATASWDRGNNGLRWPFPG